jgi:hypothetical protein
MQKILIGLFVTILLFSCDEKPVEFPIVDIPETGKIVLLEDLTGVRCPNCPAASAEIERLAADPILGQRFVALGIHGNNLTKPIDNESKYDFRNDFAIELEEYHKPFLGKPSALINRVYFENEDYIPSFKITNWESYIIKELERPQEVEILHEINYDESSRTLGLDLSIVPLSTIDSDIKISVFITESHIIDAQERQGEIIEDYEHNHVLRHMLTAYNGDPLSSSLIEGEIVKKNYSFTLPIDENGLWNDDNVEIIVAITKESPSDTRVLQAIGLHLK